MASTACSAWAKLKPGSEQNDANYFQGRARHIVVPQFTDANNWYLLADPGQVELIEIGYLGGQDAPELLVQDDLRFSEVARALNEKGHRRRGGQEWTQSAVFEMLPRVVEVAPTILRSDQWEALKSRL